MLPPDRIDIALSHRPSLGTSARAAEITGYGKLAAKVERLTALRQFLELAGSLDAKRQRMPGDASTRSYARLTKNDQTAILMNSPRRPDGPALYDGKSYSEAVHLAEDVRPFVAIAGGLRERGYSAPAIHHADLDEGFITEDFGREAFITGDPPKPIADRYQAAVDMLAAFHREPLPDVLPLAPHLDYTVPPFDNEAMMIEVGLMQEWYLPDKA
jgi:aminoglycoside/choline kinase family phosphotransferase